MNAVLTKSLIPKYEIRKGTAKSYERSIKAESIW
jgi:hypothetical protein